MRLTRRHFARVPIASPPEYILKLSQYEVVEIDPGLNAVAADATGSTWNPNDPGQAPWFQSTTSGPLPGVGGGNFGDYIEGTFSGMVVDPVRHLIVLWRRGGHTDGNDASCYRVQLNVDTPYAELFAVTTTDRDQPTPYSGKASDGYPTAYHTEDTQGYSPILDCVVGCFQQAPYPDIGSSGSLIVHSFNHHDTTESDLRTRQLSNFTEYDEFPSGEVSTSFNYGSHFHNTFDGKEYWMTHGGSAGSLHRWDEVGGDETVILPLSTLPAPGTNTTTVFVPEGNNGYAATWRLTTNVLGVVDLDTNAVTTPTVTDTGSDFDNCENMAWWAGGRRIVGWMGGDELLFLEPGSNPASDTWTVSTQATTGATIPTANTRLNGRFKTVTIAGVSMAFLWYSQTRLFAIRLSA